MQERCTIANLRTIGSAGQRKLASACVGIAGLGGVGGIAFELLVRAGVGRLKIADSGFFEESNANRQSLWTKENDGRRKTDVALDFARQVDSGCGIEAFGKISSSNSLRFASGCSAVIDATDSKRSRLAVWSGCCKAHVPYVFASALGEKGMLTVFSQPPGPFLLAKPGQSKFLSCDSQGATGRQWASLPRTMFRVAPCDHSLGPVANAIGCLAAQQAIIIAIGKKPSEFPNVISIDAFSAQQVTTHSF